MSEQPLLLALSRRFDQVVRDPIWGDIHLDASLEALFHSHPLTFLDGIRQLGPVARVYPGATHTRRAHSLGVYQLARRMALSLLERGQLPFATEAGLRSFLVAALCHDIGHFPYAHSLKELPLTPHEVLAGELILGEPLKDLILVCGALPETVAAIIDRDRPSGDDTETEFYRRLLSGVLDPDKIDYLTRDAYFCGVPYGIQDADFIVRRLLVEKGRAAVDERGAMSVEAALFSKYQMYRSVYWHPVVRAATSMVKKAVLMGMAAGALRPESLYGLDDAGFVFLFKGEGKWKIPARDALRGSLYIPVAELAYDGSNPVHEDLCDLGKRMEAEASLAAACDISDSDLVIDIPEPISFEADLRVVGGGRTESFTEREGLFGGSKAGNFVASLRKIRIFVRPGASRPSLAGLAGELLS
ncbi:MAG: HD domain-containing protein [Spirochaetes bacterium]|nr:HD domain-containing protein [Spirochaetota bacterium]